MMSVTPRRVVLSLMTSPLLFAGLYAVAPRDDVVAAPVAAPAPSVASAQETTTVLANALVAAVVSISDATPPGSSQAKIRAGNAAVSALLPDCQDTYRLIDATGTPLDRRNRPRGAFERTALLQLVGGAPVVQQRVGNQLRTLVPLTSDMHPSCVSCHAGYGPMPPGSVVGAASFRVRL